MLRDLNLFVRLEAKSGGVLYLMPSDSFEVLDSCSAWLYSLLLQKDPSGLVCQAEEEWFTFFHVAVF